MSNFQQYVGPDRRSYSSYGLTVSPGDVIDFGSNPVPPGPFWVTSAGPATHGYDNSGTVVPTNVVSTSGGYITTTSGPPTTGTYARPLVCYDQTPTQFVLIQDGTPGVWQQVATPSAGSYEPIGLSASTKNVLAQTPSRVPQPLRKLAAGRTVRTPISRGTIPAGGSLTIYSDTAGTSGIVNSIWMTASPSAIVNNIHMQVFVDGEIVPSIDVDLGTIFLGHLGAAAAKFLWSTQHMHGEGGQNDSVGGTVRFPVPYSTGCIIKLVNVSTTAVQSYTQVDAVKGVDLPYRLRSACIPQSLARTLTAAAVDTMFSTPTGSAGWLIWLGYVASTTGANESYLERNIELTFDGEATAAVVSTGGEDFFLGSFYFQNRQAYSGPDAAVSYHSASNPAQTLVGLDALERWGGFSFQSALLGKLTTKAECNVGHTYGMVALFYAPSTSPWGQPFNTAMAPTSPSISSATFSSGTSQVTLALLPSTSAQGSAITGMTLTITPSTGSPTTQALAASATSATVSVPANAASCTFTLTATNAIGTSPSSPPVTVATVATTSPVTLTTSGANTISWYKADTLSQATGSAITTWNDSSGNGYNMAAVGSTITYVASAQNSKPAVRFTGASGSYLNNASLPSTPQPVTMFVAMKQAANGTGNQSIYTPKNSAMFISSAQQLGVYAGNAVYGPTYVPTAAHIAEVVMNGASSTLSVNGATPTAANAGTNTLGAGANVGTNDVHGAEFFNGDIYEIVFVSGALNSTDRSAIRSYLGNKWGITTS